MSWNPVCGWPEDWMIWTMFVIWTAYAWLVGFTSGMKFWDKHLKLTNEKKVI